MVLKRSGTGKPKPVALLGLNLNSNQIYTISQDGALFSWNYSRGANADGNIENRKDDDGLLRWRIVQRHYFMQNNAKVKCAAYHPETNLFVTGFSNGLFGLYELPDFNMIHTLRYKPTMLTA